MNQQQKILLLDKLMKCCFSKAQYEILESFQNTLVKRNLSEKQSEIANAIYLQLRDMMIRNESTELLKSLSISNHLFIVAKLDTFIEQSPFTSLDIKGILRLTIDNCNNHELRDKILDLYKLKFL